MSTRVRTVLCFGGSVAKGVDVQLGESWPNILEREFRERNPERNLGRALFYDLSSPGATAASLLARAPQEAEARQRPKRPCLSVLEIGTNDAWIDVDTGKNVTNIEEFVAAVTGLTRILACYGNVLYVGPPHCNEKEVAYYRGHPIFATNEALQRYEKAGCIAVQCAAEEMGCEYATVPLVRATMENPDFSFADEGVHPDPAGHRFMASLIRPEFDRLVN